MFNNITTKFIDAVMPIAIKIDSLIGAASSYGTQAGVVSWLGHSITTINPLHGFGFGAVAGVVTSLVTPKFAAWFTPKPLTHRELGELSNKDQTAYQSKRLLADRVAYGCSIIVGGACGYAASIGAASAGVVAAPITLSGAALCTGTLLAVKIGYTYFAETRYAYLMRKVSENIQTAQ